MTYEVSASRTKDCAPETNVLIGRKFTLAGALGCVADGEEIWDTMDVWLIPDAEGDEPLLIAHWAKSGIDCSTNFGAD